MSELCLLAVSLIAQGQASGWQLAGLSKLPDYLPSAMDAGLSRLCQSDTKSPAQSNAKTVNAKALVSLANPDRPRPEFSSEFSPTAPAPPHPLSLSIVQTDSRTLQISSAPTGQNLTGYQPVSGANISGANTSGANTSGITAAASTPLVIAARPITGSQLYQQRVAAIQAGKTYTRLPIDSFREQWQNASEQPSYRQWVDLLRQEAEGMALGQGNGQLTVLVGDSLSLWFPPELMSSQRFWLNQSISGDTTTAVLQRLNTFKNTRPDTIHVMAGINDLRRGATDAEVVHNLRQIMRQLKQSHPQAKIIVHSILPTRLVSLPTDRIRRLNYAISTATQTEGVFFLNLQPSFSDDGGILRRDLTTDGIHLTVQGYRAWESVISSIL